MWAFAHWVSYIADIKLIANVCLLQPSFSLIIITILALNFFMLCFLHGIAKKRKE